jgi:hypothetical protein
MSSESLAEQFINQRGSAIQWIADLGPGRSLSQDCVRNLPSSWLVETHLELATSVIAGLRSQYRPLSLCEKEGNGLEGSKALSSGPIPRVAWEVMSIAGSSRKVTGTTVPDGQKG